MDKCPYCGSGNGVYTTFTGIQYYTWNGEPCGYNEDTTDNQRVYARCLKCNRRVSMKRIAKNPVGNTAFLNEKNEK